jgi:hypothetical protein
MGNRGTTPSWDDEEIAKWGLFGHFDAVRRHLDFPRRQRESERLKLLCLLRNFLNAKRSASVETGDKE